MVYPHYCVKFDEDYIKNILPKRIETYKWELCYKGLMSIPKEFDLYEKFMENIYLPKLRYDVNMLENQIKPQQEDK